VNKKVQDAPEELNAENAEESAWLVKVTVTKEEQLKDLMTKAQYDKFLESEKEH
jgi:glycine cleavage system H lipoate-binding protein